MSNYINKLKIPYTERYRFADLEQEHVDIVEDVFRKQRMPQEFKGKKAMEMYKRVKEISARTPDQTSAEVLLDLFKSTCGRLVQEVVGLKEKIYNSFSTLQKLEEEKKSLEISSTILDRPTITEVGQSN